MENKIQIDPNDAQKFVSQTLESITKAVMKPSTKLTVTPGTKFFSDVQGSFDAHTFTVKHLVPQERGAREQLYVSYDEYEFYVDMDYVREYFDTINTQINKMYIFDLNSHTYVPRPKELSTMEVIKAKLSFLRIRGKTK